MLVHGVLWDSHACLFENLLFLNLRCIKEIFLLGWSLGQAILSMIMSSYSNVHESHYLLSFNWCFGEWEINIIFILFECTLVLSMFQGFKYLCQTQMCPKSKCLKSLVAWFFLLLVTPFFFWMRHVYHYVCIVYSLYFMPLSFIFWFPVLCLC